MFKARIGWISDGLVYWTKPWGSIQRVRVADAREITAEKAVEKVLQKMHDSLHVGLRASIVFDCAEAVEMYARIVNGKVRVRRAKK